MTFPFSKDVKDLNPELNVEVVNPSKYHNVKTESAGMTFQSGHEASVVQGLILQEQHGMIFGLRLQVKFPLPGKINYIADAVYLELQDGKLMPVVEDAKGFKTKEYKLKKKLFEERFGLKISEV